MQKYFMILFALFFICANARAAQIQYDPWVSPLGERTGSVWIDGERYQVKERKSVLGTEMEVKNYNNTYKGTLNSLTNSGTLRDFNGNEIRVNSYGF